jgi:hypothetical protein
VSKFKVKKDLSDQRRKTRGRSLKEAEVLIHARDIRKAHLIERAEAAAADGQPLAKKAILAIVKAKKKKKKEEKKKKTFERLRRLLGKTNNGGLTHIIDSKEELVLDPVGMFALPLERNKDTLDGTPFTQPAMTDLYGKYDTNAASKLLLDGGLDVHRMCA